MKKSKKLVQLLSGMCLVSVLILGGCGKDEPIAYERIDLSKCTKHVLYFRNCLIARSFNTANIGVFENDTITFAEETWKTTIAQQMFNHVLIASAKRGIKVTKLASFNSFDCFVEHIFYDKQKKEAVMSFTVNFAGKIKPFYVVRPIHSDFDKDDLQALFTLLFQQASEEIAEFISKQAKEN